jgi:hypothetical protein
MVNYEDVPVKKNYEVVHPGHPAIIDTAMLADKTKKLAAGTSRKLGGAPGTVQPADPGDTPAAVLVEDSDGKNAEALAIWHGMVVQGRIRDSGGAATAEASEKLRMMGIYPTQLFTSAKKG